MKLEDFDLNMKNISLDSFTKGEGIGYEPFTRIRDIAEDKFKSGRRVKLKEDLESIIDKKDLGKSSEGTIVSLRTSFGDTTNYGGRVFIKWDGEEKVKSVDKDILEYLGEVDSKIKKAFSRKQFKKILATNRYKINKVSEKYSELVNLSSQDIWSLQEDEDGEIVLERLFDETGSPLKESK